MTLGEKQRRFTLMVASLIRFAYNQGYELTFGDAYRDPRAFKGGEPYGSEVSKHKQRLAVDFNLFKDGEYLSSTEDHALLGRYWKTLGGTWGGDWQDGNHYQYKD